MPDLPATVPEPPAGPAIAPPDRGPSAGSQPRTGRTDSALATSSPTEESTVWAMLRSPAAGGRLFVTGFIVLLFSIGGLVIVGLRRQRW